MLIPRLMMMIIAPLAVPASIATADDFSGAPVTDVTLANFKFRPATLHLQAGQPVTLRLSNSSSGGHDFSASAFFAAATIRSEDVGAIRKGHVEVGGHQSVEIALIPAAGSYKLTCHHPFHKLLGMSASIIVD